MDLEILAPLIRTLPDEGSRGGGHAGCASRFHKACYRSLCIPIRRANDVSMLSGRPQIIGFPLAQRFGDRCSLSIRLR
jgi:hypothetical protein